MRMEWETGGVPEFISDGGATETDGDGIGWPFCICAIGCALEYMKGTAD